MAELLRLPAEWSDWKIERLIGEHSHVKYYLATKSRNNKTYESLIEYIFIPQNRKKSSAARYDNMYYGGDLDNDDSIMEYIKKELEVNNNLIGIENILSYNDYIVKKKEFDEGYQIYIRMDYLRKLSDAVSQKEKITETDIIKLAIDMCSAMELLYKKNIIHGDIKSENVFIDDENTYKLGNFGVKKILDRTVGSSISNVSEINIAPEVIKDERETIRSEIYSLGLMIYRLLNNNRPPFAAQGNQPITHEENNNALVKRLSGEKLPRPSECSSDDLCQIILKACEFNPEERWQNPTAMKKALMSTYEEDYINAPQKPLEKKEKEAFDYVQNDHKEDSIPKKQKQYVDDNQNSVQKNVQNENKSQYYNTQNGGQTEYTYEYYKNDSVQQQTSNNGYSINNNNGQNQNNGQNPNNRQNQNNGQNTQGGYGPSDQKYPYSPQVNQNTKKKKTMIIGGSIAAVLVVAIVSVMAFVVPGLFKERSYSLPNNSYSAQNNQNDDELNSKYENDNDYEETETKKPAETEEQKIMVPNVEGYSKDYAKEIILDSDLTCSIEYEHDNYVSEGDVIYQDPEYGDRVKSGTEVKIVVSMGPEYIKCPEDYEQKIEVNSSGTYASMVLYQWNGWSGEWEVKFETDNVRVGENGVGKNYGEGKSITPEGKFNIGFCYSDESVETGLKFKRVTENSVFVDDERSQYYNMLVDRNWVESGMSYENTYAQFTERDLYSACIFIEHNGDGESPGTSRPGEGSVITICGIKGELKETLGCIDIKSYDMTKLLKCLDADLNPVIIIS